ncbi:DNA repair protein [Petralouisia muris]|uniref:DNA repair protein n=1 Tax=Petralouisia muris TaxID=3032872 RepID=A0AC61S2P5_9FIRM|nr:DNA repair protein [Petralouisia muris]TGY98396.1 DNA repair protein [Petralouisia muris]
MEENRYLCIDLKSFYASVECVERGLDPMKTNLAVADPERGKGALCLAISPSMKALGIKNRCRVYQIPAHVEYIMAPPRMKRYIEYSADVYAVYLKYLAKEDIHVYSIDEAFLDVAQYLELYQRTARELAVQIMADIKETTGIPAAAGMGTNLYLAKVALDLTAKQTEDSIGYLDEALYQKTLWNHRPLTDFWRVGEGIANRLARAGILTMGEIAHAEEEMLYRMFGIDAELLIDHAWGRESATMADIKSYQPKSSSLSSGQVLLRDYSFEECRLLIKEMVDALCLDLADQGLTARSVSLVVGYSHETAMKPAAGSVSMPAPANSYQEIIPCVLRLYDRIVQRGRPIRRLNVTCSGIGAEAYEQYELFTDYEAVERERKLQQAVLEIKRRFGKNALVRGMDLLEAGTAMKRNRQIGGHRSGE